MPPQITTDAPSIDTATPQVATPPLNPIDALTKTYGDILNVPKAVSNGFTPDQILQEGMRRRSAQQSSNGSLASVFKPLSPDTPTAKAVLMASDMPNSVASLKNEYGDVVNVDKALQNGFSPEQISQEGLRRNLAGTIGAAKPATMGSRLKDIFRYVGQSFENPENPETASTGQLLMTPVRALNTGASLAGEAAGQGTEKVLGKIAPQPFAEAAGKGVGWATENLVNPLNYVGAEGAEAASSKLADVFKPIEGVETITKSPIPAQSLSQKIDALSAHGSDTMAQDFSRSVLGQEPVNSLRQQQLSPTKLGEVPAPTMDRALSVTPDVKGWAERKGAAKLPQATLDDEVADAQKQLTMADQGGIPKNQIPFYGQEGAAKGEGLAEAANAQQKAFRQESAPILEQAKALKDPITKPATIIESSNVPLDETVKNLSSEVNEFRVMRDQMLPLTTMKTTEPATSLGGVFKNVAGVPGKLIDLMGPVSKVFPRMVDDASRTLDLKYHMDGQFKEILNGILKPLDAQERRLIGAVSDGQIPADVLSGNQKLTDAYVLSKKLSDKLADLQGMDRNLRLTEYFPHVWTDPESLARFNATKEIPVEGEGVFVKPVSDPFLKSRLGAKGYTYDIGDALSARIAMATRKEYINPLVQHYMQEILPKLDDAPKAYMEGYLARMQGRPSDIERGIDRWLGYAGIGSGEGSFMGRKVSNFITNAYYRSLIGVNLETAFKHVFQQANLSADVGYGNQLKGWAAMLTPKGREVFSKAGVMGNMSSLMEGMSDMISTKNRFLKIWDKIAFSPMQGMQYINRGVAFNAGLAQAADKGLEGAAAVRWAKMVVDRTMFRYGVTNISPYMNNPLGKLFYQFSTYPVNQLQFMREMATGGPQAKIAGIPVKLLRLFATQGFFIGGAAALHSDITNMLGWAKLGQLPGGKNLPETAQKIPVPGLGVPQEIIQHFANTPSPPVELGKYLGAVASGKPPAREAAGALKNLLLGAAHIPALGIEKAANLYNEATSGHTTTHSGKYAYATTPQSSLMKYLGMKPEDQQKYLARFQH